MTQLLNIEKYVTTKSHFSIWETYNPRVGGVIIYHYKNKSELVHFVLNIQ